MLPRWVWWAALIVLSGATAQLDAGQSTQQPAVEIELASRSLQPGELVVVTLSFASEPSEVRVSAFGKRFPAFADGGTRRRALVGIDVEQAPGRYTLVVDARLASGAVHETRPLVVVPRTFATRTLRVSPDFVDPPPAELERIAREAQMIRDAYAHSAAERLWDTPFTPPVPDPVNSRFGERSVFNGQPRSRHSGADFASPAGRPIKAPAAGRIVLAGDLFFTGNTVIVDHGLGMLSMFAHLSAVDVRKDDRVTAGQVVGKVGATGRVTGPHLHWALRVSDARVDPVSALTLLGPLQPAR